MGTNLVEFNVGALAELDEETKLDPGFNPVPVRMKIVHPSAQFEISGLPNQDEMEAVILAAQRARVFFPHMGVKAITDEILEFTGNRPFCRSSDYVNGELVADVDWDKALEASKMLKAKIAQGALNCLACPMDKWGSVELLGRTGNGKACAEVRRLCLWKPGWSTPVIVTFPTSSIRAWDEYCSSLSIGNLKPHYVMTRISLVKIEKPGQTYSIGIFKMRGVITDQMKQELLTPVNLRGTTQSLAKALVDIFKRREITEEDYPANGHIPEAEAGDPDVLKGSDF